MCYEQAYAGTHPCFMASCSTGEVCKADAGEDAWRFTQVETQTKGNKESKI